MKQFVRSIILLIAISSCSFVGGEHNLDSINQECSVAIDKLQDNHFDANKESKSTISADGKTLFVLNSGEVISYQTATLEKVDYFQANGIRFIGISPDGKTAVGMRNDGNMAFWDLVTGKQKFLIQIPSYHDEELDLALSPTGDEFAASWGSCESGGNVAVWDANTGKLNWHKHNGFCAGDGIAYSPDGSNIASGVSYSRTIFLWDAHTGDVQEIFSEKQPEWVSSVSFSQTGKLLAFGTGHVAEGILLAPVIVLDASDNAVLQTFDGKRDTVHSLAISPNDDMIAASTKDGSIILWSIKTGNHLCTLSVSESNLDVFFAQNDSLVSVQEDGILKLWSLGK